MSHRADGDARLVDVSVLGVVAIVAYGACYYAYGVLLAPIGAGTRWPAAALGAIFSSVLLVNGAGGMVAGRVLDRAGERPLFALAAVVGAGAMLMSSFQTALLPFAVAYAGGCGLVGALGYYHITQSVAARRAPASPARAIIWLTLFGAFAGPVYQPVTGWLVVSVGWRGAIRVEAATVAAAFLLAALVARPRASTRPDGGTEHLRAVLRGALRDPRMRVWLLSTVLASAAVDVFLVFQVPAMHHAGLSLAVAASVAGFRGVAQLAGRLPLRRLLDRLGTRGTLFTAYLLGAGATLLLLGSGNLALALVLSLLAGASFGAISALQGIYTYELVDRRHLGTLLGTQQAVYGVGGAAGPLVAGALLGATGSYVPMIAAIVLGFAAATGVLLVT